MLLFADMFRNVVVKTKFSSQKQTSNLQDEVKQVRVQDITFL